MSPPAATQTTGPAPRAPYSKDYWDLVLGQLRKRKSVRLAAALLALLYATAIYAPFLANDKPLLYEGTNYSEYRAAHRLIRVVAADLVKKAEQGREGFAASRAEELERGKTLEGTAKADWQESWDKAPATFEDWVALDRGALDWRLDVIRRQLAPEHHAALDAVAAAADEVVDAAQAGDTEALTLAGEQLSEAAGVVSSTLRPTKVGDEPKEGRSVALQPATSYPVLESLVWNDIYFMVLWAFALLFPLWNRVVNGLLLRGDPERIRRARRRKVLTVVVLPALITVVWVTAREGSGGQMESVSIKEALAEGKAEVTEVIYPPVAYGMAEQNQTETFRPPTWTAGSRIDAEGFYETGARSLRVDEETGMERQATPVDVRPGEDPLNSPWRHVLGTDSLGRDLFARMIWGARISLAVGLISTVLLVFIGTVLGSVAGYFGGWVDIVISRIIEIFQCFPVFFLILIVVSFMGSSILNIMLAIGIFRWTGVARLVRGEFIRLRGQDFVVASQALGVRSLRTIFRHVLPNALGPVLVAATFAVASGILTESALSFLGFGVQLPVPSWGSLLVETRSAEYWWIQVFPGLVIFLTVVLYNLVGEGVRDALDPRLKEE